MNHLFNKIKNYTIFVNITHYIINMNIAFVLMLETRNLKEEYMRGFGGRKRKG